MGPKPDRTLKLDPDCNYQSCVATPSDSTHKDERFSACETRYQTIYYNTFWKDGGLKLTEIELYFLSSHMTKASCSEWVVVYLGIGDGERFRWLRDTFFPGLWVIGFDPAPD